MAGNKLNSRIITAVVAVCAVLSVLGAVAAFAWSWHDDSSEGIRDNSAKIGASEVKIDRNETDIKQLYKKSNGIAAQLGEVKTTVVEIRTLQSAQGLRIQEMNSKLSGVEKMNSKLDEILRVLPREESP